MKAGSRLPGFYNLSLEERRSKLFETGLLTPQELAALTGESGLSLDAADHMIENVVGLHSLPVGIALNFVINRHEVLIPMAIEEPSVVAGASSWQSWRGPEEALLPRPMPQR